MTVNTFTLNSIFFTRVSKSKLEQFEELDKKVNSLVTQRENAWFFPNWRFGKSIKLARVQRMKVGEAITQDDSSDEPTLQKVKEVFNKELFKQLKGNQEVLKHIYIDNLRLISTQLPNLETNSLTAIKEFQCESQSLSQFASNYKTGKNNADLEFTIQLGDSIFKVKGMGYDAESRLLKGTGSYGRVFLGKNIVTGQEVAIKVASPPKNQTLSETLEIEASNLLAVKGLPNTVGSSSVSIDHDNKLMFAVMDKIDGAQELFNYNKYNNIPTKEKIKILRQGATALEACHAINIIHRDIKLENFLIDSKGNAYLIDFGFARNSNTSITKTEGTPEYLAPEVLRKQQQTKQTDSFSYGLMMYELFVGLPPDYSTNRSILYDNRLRRRNGLTEDEKKIISSKGASQKIINIIDRCLKHNKLLRPTMTEIKKALS